MHTWVMISHCSDASASLTSFISISKYVVMKSMLRNPLLLPLGRVRTGACERCNSCGRSREHTFARQRRASWRYSGPLSSPPPPPPQPATDATKQDEGKEKTWECFLGQQRFSNTHRIFGVGGILFLTLRHAWTAYSLSCRH